LQGIVFIYEENRCSVKNSAFHLAPWWNPAVENQAVDRSYRIGQKNSGRIACQHCRWYSSCCSLCDSKITMQRFLMFGHKFLFFSKKHTIIVLNRPETQKQGLHWRPINSPGLGCTRHKANDARCRRLLQGRHHRKRIPFVPARG